MRTILHADANNFYASVECSLRPELKSRAVVVCGDAEARHGIILAKNEMAKSVGIKTGEAIWQARQKCPELVCLPANFKLYMDYSSQIRRIFGVYSDYVEPFGLDEAWLDITQMGKGYGKIVADELREQVKSELGITLSVGVSFNKIFAKLGSDMKKPDATTVISPANYRDKVWPLPAEDLLYVGRATRKKLAAMGVTTIGELAQTDIMIMRKRLGKMGEVLWAFANGFDTSPVARTGDNGSVKSIGNSTTTPRDMENMEDVKTVAYVLSESVAARLREQGLKCRTVQVSIRTNDLCWFERQIKLNSATWISDEIAANAMILFEQNCDFEKPLRSIGVRACDLENAYTNQQLSCLENDERREKLERLDCAIDYIRKRFGHYSITRGLCLTDRALGQFNPKDDHTIHPVGYF